MAGGGKGGRNRRGRLVKRETVNYYNMDRERERGKERERWRERERVDGETGVGVSGMRF